MKKTTLVLAVQMIVLCSMAQVTLLPFGSTWKYLDDGSNQGSAWQQTNYDDNNWASGPAELGYGDGDEATEVSYGPDKNNKYITTYFRTKLALKDPSLYEGLQLKIKRDDGAVVYINGKEVYRNNMGNGIIAYNTPALRGAGENDGSQVFTAVLDNSVFVAGENVIAVEIHQYKASNSDISFDFELIAAKEIIPNPPVANAGDDNMITLPLDSILLNGKLSSDADGNIASYKWEQVSGPNDAKIIRPDSAKTSAKRLIAGTYTFQLTVTDSTGLSASDLVVVTINPAIASSYNVIDFGSLWKYLDDGSDQGILWRQPTYDDVLWKTGNGVLGYGNGDETTEVGYGPDAEHKYITTYFRKAITITDPSAFADFTLRVKRDDGVVVYVNGIEVYRNQIPDGEPAYNQLATRGAADDGYEPQIATIASHYFSPGNNIIAVEIHQNTVYNSDIAFDMELVANAPAGNFAPTAKAGDDQTIALPANAIVLDGSQSLDPDGFISTWHWAKIAGPDAFNLADPDSAITNVDGLIAGTYTFELTVMDNDSVTATDAVVITVNPATNKLPVANAGPDQQIALPVNNVSLDGSKSTDPDGTIASYAWSKISGPATYTITSPNSAATTINGLVEGTYIFRLTVTDNDGDEASDDVIIIVNKAANIKPIANAGSDQEITLPTNSASLDGSESSDADGAIVSYAWTKVSGPATYSISNASSATTSLSNLVSGTYTFRLTVIDNDDDIATDDVVVTVNPALNKLPVANAGSDQQVILPNNSTTLDGSKSTDPDGTIASYAWTKISGPSSYTIGAANSATTTVSNLVAGSYVFRLTVTDNDGDAGSDDVMITVVAATNVKPTANAGSDQLIMLPANSVTLDGSKSSDPDGNITTYSWSKISGPSSYNITSSGNASTSVTSLVAGTYTFRLTVTDNSGDTNTDDVVVTVNANNSSIIITRGPYLQMANQNAVTLRWRTDAPSDSRISVGTTAGSYTLTAVDNKISTEHEVRISGLKADTKYFYSFGSSSETLQAGTANFFHTAPPANTIRKMHIAAFGDCGRNQNDFQTGTLNAYLKYAGSNPAELMLLLGDNAYTAGTDNEYSQNFFGVYSSSVLKNHILFPTPGNHDYASSSSRQRDHNIPYYDNFTMPTAAECGGVASGTEAYYSYNWGNIHFISIDSYGFEEGDTRLYDTLGPQVTWIKKDLAANTSKWTIAYWHHPPYTKGSHNSDTESELVKIRERFIRILERNGVDMILCGHSHDYERSYLLKGYYGNESSFDIKTNTASSSSGMYDGSSNSCPYVVPSGRVNHGTVYVVAGSSGADGTVQSGYPHDALPFAVDDGGLLYFEVENNRLDAKFIRRDGVIADKFTIMKDAGQNKQLSINSGESVTLTASWTGTYKWSNGATSQSITVSPTSSTTYTCKDAESCIEDSYNITVGSPLEQITLAPSGQYFELNAYPIPVKKGGKLTITSNSNQLLPVVVINDKGQKIKQFKMQSQLNMITSDMRPGIYYIRAEIDGKKMTKKIMVIE